MGDEPQARLKGFRVKASPDDSSGWQRLRFWASVLDVVTSLGASHLESRLYGVVVGPAAIGQA
uniref:Uncharacterized protein n=1 Tax=Oryza meridionalis TaxID=40149 RepID=A0A0E0DNF3_9ORYZ